MENIIFTAPTPAEILLMQWAAIRTQRDRLIAETDWTLMIDSPLSAEKQAAFTAYRKALRDLPKSTDTPDKIVWPVKP
jgi:hypothetical protein